MVQSSTLPFEVVMARASSLSVSASKVARFSPIGRSVASTYAAAAVLN